MLDLLSCEINEDLKTQVIPLKSACIERNENSQVLKIACRKEIFLKSYVKNETCF